MANNMKLEVREMQDADIERVVDYFVTAGPDYLRAMGADPGKLPGRDEWIARLTGERTNSYAQRAHYYMIWLVNGRPTGHSNINHILYGHSAKMHLHLWTNTQRRRGLGLELLKLTIPHYFTLFGLQTLVCEPFAGNPAPNRVLEKLGFKLVRTYDTTPGWINLDQTVNRYEMTRDAFDIKNWEANDSFKA